MQENSTRCKECGNIQYIQPQRTTKTEGTSSSTGAISVATGVIGLLIFGLPLGIVSVILGIKSIESTAGKIGLILGVVDIIGVLLFLGSL